MNKAGWFTPITVQRVAGSIGVAVLMMTTGMAVAQDATPAAQPVAPNGYTLHESIDLGGHVAGVYGSGAMYDTMVNLESGPRVLGESFELKALPDTKHTLLDSLSVFSNGFGGDPNDFARIDFYKGNLYEFSGNFVRDRQYFDYDLLGNPNIPSGLTTPVSGTSTPYTFPQVEQSPFLYNTVRRRSNVNLTIFPVSKLSYQASYSQDVFQGPSLTPSGYQLASSYTVLLQEMQRNSTDSFTGEVDWKPVPLTHLTFEEVIDHYKADSYFTMDPSYFRVQEPDGTKVALLYSYDATAPSIACNANSVGATPTLTASATPGGLPVVNPACSVISSYFRSQPTRILYPTEIFRFQSSSIRNISMNGDIRYTKANMSLPLYQDVFQGLAKTTRYVDYTAKASAKREVTAVDYAFEWRATRKVSFEDQFTFSNEQEPGVSTMTSVTTTSTPATAGNETINNNSLTTTVVNTATTPATGTFEGSGSIGVPVYDFFGQRFITNDVTGTWDGWSRATLSLTYRHVSHLIGEGIPHNAPLALGATNAGTVTINQNGGVFNVALRPNDRWNVNGSAELLYADNVFTPVAPRQLQHYRVHALYRPKTWATLSGAFNDMELHNNTNNNQADIVPPFTGSPTGTAYAGPLDHVAHTRVVGLGAQLSPTEHYALDFNYAYSDVYTSTNICYLAGDTATLPGAATPSGTACPATAANRGNTWDFGPARDFEDAPTNSLQAALTYSPVKRFHSNIGYNLNDVAGTRFYNDARDVAGSLHSKYQSPFVGVAWTVRPGFIWNARYNYYGYGEGGPSGAPYCTTAGPSPTTPSTVVACNSSTLAGLQTGLTLPNSGETAAREFHANILTVGFHYEF